MHRCIKAQRNCLGPGIGERYAISRPLGRAECDRFLHRMRPPAHSLPLPIQGVRNMANPADSAPDRIDPSDEASLALWARKLDVTPAQLQDAVRAVGNRASDVELHLKGSRSTTNEERVEAQDRRS
jgi:hypothetical protein